MSEEKLDPEVSRLWDQITYAYTSGGGWPEHLNNAAHTARNVSQELTRLRAEAEALRRFAQQVMAAWPHGDLDGGELQEAAIEAGLLEPVTVTGPCRDEGCMCAEAVSAEEFAEGVVCYRRTALLKGAAQAAKERT